jgi:hypothetical protein
MGEEKDLLPSGLPSFQTSNPITQLPNNPNNSKIQLTSPYRFNTLLVVFLGLFTAQAVPALKNLA